MNKNLFRIEIDVEGTIWFSGIHKTGPVDQCGRGFWHSVLHFESQYVLFCLDLSTI